ncbi:GNAT family N-acetyltransferase [Desertimonas flava]|jgi:predicted N-acetyltransferase YhbS|uniref:GNAT family N-acetyltransferase n=1 Tax=Desertimonas flava TaxID=2064846 RepID=UPI000E34BCF6|nr:GNAT family N-acetyltransferase [Desertimonas flava]
MNATDRGAVRVANPHEHDAVRAVTAAAFEQYRAVLPSHLFDLYVADLVDIEARADASEQLVVDGTDGRIVASVSYYPDASDEGLAWPSGWSGLRALAVDPDHRGSGAGRRLMDACRQRAAAAGSPVLALHTAEFMRAAVSLYEKTGFRRAPQYDLRPSDLLDVDSDGLPQVIAYTLALA